MKLDGKGHVKAEASDAPMEYANGKCGTFEERAHSRRDVPAEGVSEGSCTWASRVWKTSFVEQFWSVAPGRVARASKTPCVDK